MIQVQNLRKEYGPIVAVDGISFTINSGEIVGFLGLNGAGKSTTMRILTTFLPATSGIATVAGFDVMNDSMEVRRRIGYLPESVPLYPEMRVEEYLDYRAKLKQVDRSVRKKRIESAMERCRITQVRRRLVGTLSKGYRQRVGLADALSHEPQILILDEPTTGLDPLQRRETLNTIRDLARNHTVILSTHILTEVEQTCERVIIVHRGRIGLDSRLEDLGKEAVTAVLAEIKGPPDAVAAALTDLGAGQVMATAQEDGWNQFVIRGSGRRDVREDVFQTIQKNGWSLRRLDIRQRHLDDHFLALVRHEDDPLDDDLDAMERGPRLPLQQAGSTAIQSAPP